MITFKDFRLMGFHGFYSGFWVECYDMDNEELSNRLMDEKGISYEDAHKLCEGVDIDEVMDLDMDSFKDVVNNHYPSTWAKEINDSLFYSGRISNVEHEIKVIGNINAQSPRFYNFDSDIITCDITLTDGMIADIVEQIDGEFNDTIRDDFKSRDGFVSNISNDWDVWKNELLTNPSSDNSKTYMEYILMFVMQLCDTEQNIFEYMSGNGIYISTYYSFNENGKKLFNIK